MNARSTGRNTRPLHLPLEHGELVAQDHDLEILIGIGFPAKDKELEETLDHDI
jgi:hypothetical protein